MLRVRALEHVPIAGHQQAAAACLALLRREGAQEVVRLEIVRGGDLPAEGAEEVAGVLPLGPQLIGEGRLAIGVIGGEELDAVRGRVGAEAEHHRPGVVRLDLPEDQVRRAEQGVDRIAVRALDRLRQGVERPEEHRGGVDREQGACHAPQANATRAPVQAGTPSSAASTSRRRSTSPRMPATTSLKRKAWASLTIA